MLPLASWSAQRTQPNSRIVAEPSAVPPEGASRLRDLPVESVCSATGLANQIPVMSRLGWVPVCL